MGIAARPFRRLRPVPPFQGAGERKVYIGPEECSRLSWRNQCATQHKLTKVTQKDGPLCYKTKYVRKDGATAPARDPYHTCARGLCLLSEATCGRGRFALPRPVACHVPSA
eukprot:260914-Prymnesium_polylepis.1